MGSLLPENLCVHRKGAIKKLINDRARDAATQPQILFGKPPGDHDGPEEILVELFTSFTDSLFSQVLMSSCEDCEVTQIPNQVRSPIGEHRSVYPGESSKRPAAKDLNDRCKRRRTHKHDHGCQATEQAQYWIQKGPHMFRTDYFGHHTGRSYPLNNPQNPLLESHYFSFTSETISSPDSEPNSQSLKSETISTQDSESYRLSFSSETISTQDSEPSSASSAGTILRRSEMVVLAHEEGAIMSFDTVHQLSNEEFRRRIEDFIAKQRRLHWAQAAQHLDRNEQ